MFRVILLICCVLLFGCAADEIDVGHLNQHDKGLFQIAADKEGVLTVENPYPSAWWVWRDELEPRERGRATQYQTGECLITIAPVLEACPNSGTDQRFIITARHEIRHCQGEEHNDDPDHLMHKNNHCEPKYE